MSSLKGDKVTKYDAGGSGDNYIADGYIKTVEKVWLDEYTNTATISAGDTLDIAKVPENKKITGVKVLIPADQASTKTTISIGLEDGDGTTDSTLFLAATAIEESAGSEYKVLEANQGFPKVTSNGENTVYIETGTGDITTTGGTFTFITKYT